MKNNKSRYTAPSPLPLQTGSVALDRLLARERIQSGRVLHLCGGSEGVARALTLNWIKDTIRGYESCVYFDLDGTLSDKSLQRAGLSATAIQQPNGDEDVNAQNDTNLESASEQEAPLQVLSPTICREFDEALRALTARSPAPVLVVVSGLERLLFNHINRHPSTESIATAGRVAHTMLQKYRQLCLDSGQTLLFVHSPQSPKPSCSAGILLEDAASPGAGETSPKLRKTLRGTMFAHCAFGLELRRTWREGDSSDSFSVELQAWRYNTEAGAAQTIEMWNDGGFKNP